MRIQLQGPGHAASVLAELNRCRQTRQYCDVFLQVGNRTFAAHRAVLACAGTYFQSLFSRTATPSAVFSLEFVSPANFEKVLLFVYTGQILIDLIDVGVLYELAERLGVGELVRTCHATFPDLQASAACRAGSSGELPLDSCMGAPASTAVSAASVCSSVASCSSLSSSVGPGIAAAPTAAPSPLFQSKTSRPEPQGDAPTLEVKAEDVQSHIGYGQLDHPLHGHLLSTENFSSQTDGVLPPGPVLQLKTEQILVDGTETCKEGDQNTQMISASLSGSQNINPTVSDSCSLPDSSGQVRMEACPPTLSSEEQGGSLHVESVEGGVMDIQRDGGLMFDVGETGESGKQTDPLRGAEGEQWSQLASEIIELSDDENYLEEEEDEDDLVFVENGDTREGGTTSNRVEGSTLSCKACGAALPADPAAIRSHCETHLTELGLCKLCGASFSDGAAGILHCLSHVGLQLFTCDMCRLQFCSLNKLLRHCNHSTCSYSIPQGALSSSQDPSAELKCGVCSKTLSKDFEVVREHTLTHVCPQSLTCGVCHTPQLSLCSLLWHCLSHVSLPVFFCPHCALCFVELPLLDRHMSVHAEEAAAKERECLRADGGVTAGEVEELHCFLCPQTFRSPSALQNHLSLHTPDSLGSHNLLGKRKADQPSDGPPLSSSSQNIGGLSKVVSLGLGAGMSFNMSEKYPQELLQGSSGVLTNGNSGQEGGGARGKWYRCRFCSKRFAHSGEFTYHLRIHTGEKPYQCKVCLRFFRGRSTMICHLKTHAGALMYRCTVCSLFFSTVKLVSSHMELHKDQLPPNFKIEETFMYNDHSKEPLPNMDS